ncbi:unnamed protein product [Larinioides sclopetarius]|uniref:Uncharacterized protein n=1 Tax=Larinioides sclopetarius TaxID=280406 RepID=A0AAV2BE42_9ARAC
MAVAIPVLFCHRLQFGHMLDICLDHLYHSGSPRLISPIELWGCSNITPDMIGSSLDGRKCKL